MRNAEVDKYMEARFGKPDFTKTFYNPHDGRFWTPMGNKKHLWRVDPVSDTTEPQPDYRYGEIDGTR